MESKTLFHLLFRSNKFLRNNTKGIVYGSNSESQKEASILQKERLTKDVRYQEFNEVALDDSDLRPDSSRAASRRQGRLLMRVWFPTFRYASWVPLGIAFAAIYRAFLFVNSVNEPSEEKVDQRAALLPPSLREVARRSRDGGSVLSQEAALPQSRLASCQPPQGGDLWALPRQYH